MDYPLYFKFEFCLVKQVLLLKYGNVSSKIPHCSCPLLKSLAMKVYTYIKRLMQALFIFSLLFIIFTWVGVVVVEGEKGTFVSFFQNHAKSKVWNSNFVLLILTLNKCILVWKKFLEWFPREFILLVQTLLHL